MHSTLRSATGRTRLEAQRTRDAVASCIRHFSASGFFAEENSSSGSSKQPQQNNNNNKPVDGRSRSRAAASEISSLLRGTSASSGARGGRGGLDDARTFRGRGVERKTPLNVIGLRSVPREGGAGIVQVPAGFGGRGGGAARRSFRGPGGVRGRRCTHGGRLIDRGGDRSGADGDTPRSGNEERAHFVARQPDFKFEGAEEAVRKVILERAVKGEHEKPQYSEGKKPVDLARNAHLKDPTYREKDVETFEAKVKQLIASKKGSAGQQGKKAQA
ncbi:uncharacterized protein VDAG_06858 [Verticillium dahliae VdLs.17]|uniref:Uncharacterized protein n=1 Tax=Verticillium dahliae (strain VdLs.17 / ATCC MYA-4575 / FGSC 10137) TaxID=498257 RepID=G2X9M6_VERDV|nr:uncharacterized protein VDAG_06858 [Verticillium dahliae VdLs.17]EGY15694.1 hypothetical protein VDAG_06858 [Verticillium dahliae VdLs.17]